MWPKPSRLYSPWSITLSCFQEGFLGLPWAFLIFLKVYYAYLELATPVLNWTPCSCAPLSRDTPCSRVSSITRIHLLKHFHWLYSFLFNCSKDDFSFQFHVLSHHTTLISDSWIFWSIIPFPWTLSTDMTVELIPYLLVEHQTFAQQSHISNSTFIICPLSDCPPTQTLKVFSDFLLPLKYVYSISSTKITSLNRWLFTWDCEF